MKRPLPVPQQRAVPDDFWAHSAASSVQPPPPSSLQQDQGRREQDIADASAGKPPAQEDHDGGSAYGSDPPTSTELDSPEDKDTEEPYKKARKQKHTTSVGCKQEVKEEKHGNGNDDEADDAITDSVISVEILSVEGKWIANADVKPFDKIQGLVDVQLIAPGDVVKWRGSVLQLNATWMEQCDLTQGYLLIEVGQAAPSEGDSLSPTLPVPKPNNPDGVQQPAPERGVRVVLRSWPKGRKTYKAYLDPGATILELYAEFAALSKRGINTFRLYQGSEKLPDDMPILDLNPDFLVSVVAYPTRVRPHPEWTEVPPSSGEDGPTGLKGPTSQDGQRNESRTSKPSAISSPSSIPSRSNGYPNTSRSRHTGWFPMMEMEIVSGKQ